MQHFAALKDSPKTRRAYYADIREKDAAIAEMLKEYPNAAAFIAPNGNLIVDGWV